MHPIYQREIPNYSKKHFEKTMFNKKFGHLRVLGISDQTNSTNVHYVICLCDCGKTAHIKKASIVSGATRSCGNCFSFEEDILNKKFGHLKVIGKSEKKDKLGRIRYYLTCLCDCEKIVSIRRDGIISGRVTSCCRYETLDNVKKRFMENIKVDSNGCWIWQASTYKDKWGRKTYGRFFTKLFPKECKSHRISYLMFNGPIPKEAFICHKCSIPSCNNPYHIYCGNHTSNTEDMVNANRQAKGEHDGNSRYTKEIVLKARELRENGMTYKQIGEELNVHVSSIERFIKKKVWKHI